MSSSDRPRRVGRDRAGVDEQRARRAPTTLPSDTRRRAAGCSGRESGTRGSRAGPGAAERRLQVERHLVTVVGVGEDAVGAQREQPVAIRRAARYCCRFTSTR